MISRKTVIKINKAIELKKQIAADTKEYDKLKTELIADLSADMSNKNLKHKAVFTKKGYVSVSDKESYEVTNRPLLEEILGKEQVSNYVTTTVKTDISYDNKFMEALGIAVEGDYEFGDIAGFLENTFGLGKSEAKKIAKKFKGKYVDDYKILKAISNKEGDDIFEEEINQIRLMLNANKVSKYISPDILNDRLLMNDLGKTFITKGSIQTVIKGMEEMNTTAEVE